MNSGCASGSPKRTLNSNTLGPSGVTLVLGAVQAWLAEGGTAWVGDPHRTAAEDFPLAAVEAGFKVTTVNLEGPGFSGGGKRGRCIS